MTKKDIELKAQIREINGNKSKTLLKKGFIPAIVYGAGQKNTPLKIDYQEFSKVFEEAGESTIIKLKIKNKEKQEEKNVLIHDVAKDSVTDKLIHIDFLQVRMDKTISAEVPLVFEGESPAVKGLDGVLVKNIIEIEVEALPKDLPHNIKVDISVLETFDDYIKVKDLKLSENINIKLDPEEVIASVSAPRSQEELEALEKKPEEGISEEVKEKGEGEKEELKGEGEEKETKEEEKQD